MIEETQNEMTLFDPSVGDLGLAFIDTVSWRQGDEPEEMLHTCADFIIWAREAGLVDAAQSETLTGLIRANPDLDKTALAEIIRLREVLYRLVTALMGGHTPPAEDLERFNAALRAALAQREIRADGPEPRWVWRPTISPLADLLHPVLLAAAELFVSEDRSRIRACSNPACGWLFVDRSRNQSRKWCSSTSCGNRIRVRQFYSRSRKTGQP